MPQGRDIPGIHAPADTRRHKPVKQRWSIKKKKTDALMERRGRLVACDSTINTPQRNSHQGPSPSRWNNGRVSNRTGRWRGDEDSLRINHPSGKTHSKVLILPSRWNNCRADKRTGVWRGEDDSLLANRPPLGENSFQGPSPSWWSDDRVVNGWTDGRGREDYACHGMKPFATA